MDIDSQVVFNEEQLQKLYRYTCALKGTEQDAYDLLQSSLEKYIKSDIAKQPSTYTNPVAYLRQIIRNTYIDQIRHNALIQWDDFDENEVTSSDLDWNGLEQSLINEQDAEYVIEKMNGLEREIIFLWAVEGYTTKEVAEYLNMPKNTVLSRIYRLRKKIQSHYHHNENKTLSRRT